MWRWRWRRPASEAAGAAAGAWAGMAGDVRWQAAGVALLAALVYSNTLGHGFVYDDTRAILSNPDVHSSSLTQLLLNDYWGTPIRSASSHGSYRPLSVMSFRLDRWLWGGLRPAGFHATNVLLHSAVSALVLVTARALLPGGRGAPLAGGLFAVHPVHAEAVAGCAGRADLLAALLSLLAFRCYRRHAAARDRALYAGEESTGKRERRGVGLARPEGGKGKKARSALLVGAGALVRDAAPWGREASAHFASFAALAGCSLLAKEPGLAVVPLAVCYDVLLHLRHAAHYKVRCSVAKSALWSCAVAAAAAGGRLAVAGLRAPEFSRADNPAAKDPSALARTLTFLYLPLFNALLLLWPGRLCFDWGMDAVPRVTSLLDRRVPATLAFYYLLFRVVRAALRPAPAEAAACASCPAAPDAAAAAGHSARCRLANNNNAGRCRCRPRRPRPPRAPAPAAAAALALAALALPFLPATNLFFYVGFVVAERVLYLPSVGFCLLVALGWQSLLPYVSSTCASSPPPTSPPLRATSLGWLVVLAALGARTLQRNADWRDDEALYRSATGINPPKAWGNLGSVLGTAGRLAEAEEALRTALHYRPNMADVHYNLGNLLARRNKIDDSITSYKLAVYFRPSLAVAHLNLGEQLEASGASGAAEAAYGECWRTRADGVKDPATHEEARRCCLRRLARLCASAGVSTAHACRPDTLAVLNVAGYKPLPAEVAGAHLDHAAASLLSSNRSATSEAEKIYLRSIQLVPNDPVVYVNYGRLLAGEGRAAEAAAAFVRAARLAPGSAALAATAADALRHAGRLADAEAEYRRARDLNPLVAASHSNLGAIYHLRGKYREAAESYRRALRMSPDDRDVATNLQRLRSLQTRSGR